MYLEQLSVTTIKHELEGHISAILNARDIRRRKIYGETEGTLSIHLEERNRLREVPKILRVAEGGQDSSDCTCG